MPEFVPEKNIQPDITSYTSQIDDQIEDVNVSNNQDNSAVTILSPKEEKEGIDLESKRKHEVIVDPATSLSSPISSKSSFDSPNGELYYVQKEFENAEQKEKLFKGQMRNTYDEGLLSRDIFQRNNGAACTKPWWPVLLGSIFYFFNMGVDGFFQSQTYSFALCGPLELEPKAASYINFAYFGSYCLGRLISIPLSQKVCPSTILSFSLISCCLSSAFLSFCGGMSLEALLVGTALMGFSICFQFASCLTWLASRIPNGMKSIHTSLMFTGANCGWLILPPLASALFYQISPNAPFVTAFICNVLHLGLFIFMHKSTKVVII